MSLVKRFFTFFFTSSLLLLLAMSCLGILAPMMNPDFLSFAQLIPAILFFLVPLQLICWRFFKNRSKFLAVFSILVLVLSIWVGSRDFTWSIQKESEEKTVKVVSYNARNFNFTGKEVDSVIKILAPLKPDVVCFQEFRNYKVPNKGKRAAQYLSESLGLPAYRHFRTGKYFQGTAIFSRYPIVSLDTLYINFDEPNNGILATLKSPYGKIGIGNFHLTSFRFSSGNKEEDRFWNSLKRFKNHSLKQIPVQHQHLDEVLEKGLAYPYPLILTADMNSAPHSKAACRMRQHYQDSFLSKGKGTGWSFPLWKNLGVRIDYQFASEQVEILSHEVIPSEQSDHYPLLGIYRISE